MIAFWLRGLAKEYGLLMPGTDPKIQGVGQIYNSNRKVGFDSG
jgi:hypothetical protein